MEDQYERALTRYDFRKFAEEAPKKDGYYVVLDESLSGACGSGKWSVDTKTWTDLEMPGWRKFQGDVSLWAPPPRVAYSCIEHGDY